MKSMLACFVTTTLGLTGAPAFAETPGERAYADLIEYVGVIQSSPEFDECLDASEPHQCVRGPRSGTGLGLAVHDWMRDELVTILGAASVSRQTLGFDRFVPRDYSLSVETDETPFRPAVYPWYYKGVTPPGGLTAPLVDVGNGSAAEYAFAGSVSGKIVVLHTPLALNAGPVAYTQGGFQRALDGGAVGMVIVPQAPGNELIAFNADARLGMGPLPTVVVGKIDGARLAGLDGRLATLVVDATIESGAEFTNEIGVIPGEDPRNVIVIGTPLNGWFTVATERGPGVGGFLELARTFAARAAAGSPPRYTLLFLATGGHEVTAPGLEHAFACLDREKVVSYVHFGAGIAGKGFVEAAGTVYETGLAEPNRLLIISENPLLEAIGESAFRTKPGAHPLLSVPPRALNPGEQQFVYNLGVPMVTISGAGIYHHAPADTPEKTTPELIDPMARAYVEVVEALLELDADLVRDSNLLATTIAPAAEPLSCGGE